MQQETIDKVRKFGAEHDMRVETHEYHEHPVFWEVTVWVTKTADYAAITGKPNVPRVWGRKYLSTPTAGGMVLVIRNPRRTTSSPWNRGEK